MEDLARCVKEIRFDTKIYKDQCVHCFNTAVHAPLYIDFSNYWGYCYEHLSSGEPRDAVYLKHTRMVKDSPAPEDKPPATKVTRLAIGVEGGFDANSEQIEYEDTYGILVRRSDGSEHYDLSNGCLPDIIITTAEMVISSSSAAQQEQSNQWEGDVRVNSKFSEGLEQLDNGVKVPPAPWKCSIEGCDKADNLWMNLTCGTILCGRKFFDGSGGNNHAVEYYERTRYPLAVKLGTITAQGGDVYSYQEDDMVIDPQLARHLTHFGISMMDCEKTEKTMNELEIAANLNLKLEYDNILESGVALKPVYGPNYLGFINLGNTCYLNSVLQVMLNCVGSIAEKYSAYSNPGTEVPTDFCEQLKNLAQSVNNPGQYSVNPESVKRGHENGVRPVLLKCIIGKGHPEFSSSRQQDAHELYLHLISLFEKQVRKYPNLKCSDALTFEVEERIQCDTSKQVLYKTRQDYCLSLPIPLDKAKNFSLAREWELKRAELEKSGEKIKPEDCVKYQVDFEDCISCLASPETISDFLSPATNTKTTANKTFGLRTFPDYLMVQVRRFTLTENWQPKKLDVLINVPDMLDISALRSSGLKPGEVEFPAAAPLQPDPDIVTQLMGMGFSFDACQNGAYHTKNVGLEAAMEYILSHMDDPALNEPLVTEQPAAASVSSENVEMLQAMGFSAAQARKALQQCDNNLERAADWVFSHAHELDEADDAPAPAALPDGPGHYRLRAFISHMGTSTACGHYVCHILDKQGRWVLYNDEKVAVSVTPPRDMAYMYLFERLS